MTLQCVYIYKFIEFHGDRNTKINAEDCHNILNITKEKAALNYSMGVMGDNFTASYSIETKNYIPQ